MSIWNFILYSSKQLIRSVFWKKKIDMVNWNMYIINTSNLSSEEKSLSILLKKMIMGIDFKNMLMACKKTKQVIT